MNGVGLLLGFLLWQLRGCNIHWVTEWCIPWLFVLDAPVLPCCSVHALHFHLYIQELIWLKEIKHLADHWSLIVQI